MMGTKMRISLITITYPPEIGGAAHLIHELALGLKEKGHQVCVLTGYPSYNIKDVPPQYRRGSRMTEEIDGVTVRRIRFVNLPRESIAARGFQHFMYGLWLSWLWLRSPKADRALVFSPPLPLPWMIVLLGRLRRPLAAVNIQDLFPREAVELGVLKNRLLIGLFEAMERQVYRLAAGVTVHSPGNREHVISRGGRPEKVRVIYNWVNTDQIRPGPRMNDFARQHDLSGRFVVSYAGTMGWAQDMGTIVDCARRLSSRPEILFLMVGDGVEKEKAVSAAKSLGLANILWLPMQPLAVYPQILAASDVSMINLHPELRTPVVPSKLLSIMSAGRPVVASLPAESDARAIIADAGCGVCVEAGNGAALADAILNMQADPAAAEAMGRRGREYVESHFSRSICIDQMERFLMEL